MLRSSVLVLALLPGALVKVVFEDCCVQCLRPAFGGRSRDVEAGEEDDEAPSFECPCVLNATCARRKKGRAGAIGLGVRQYRIDTRSCVARVRFPSSGQWDLGFVFHCQQTKRCAVF